MTFAPTRTTMTVIARLYVIRHGETEWNRARIIQGQADSQLNDLGETQAAMTGEALKAIHFDKAFTSDLSRASKVHLFRFLEKR